MPIRPENRGRYPKTWRDMVRQARERSGDRCECLGQCGLDHGGRCNVENHKPHPRTGSVVVLTLAHEHGVPLEETSIDRMFHACQQCHLRYDKHIHAANRRETIRARKATGDLFGLAVVIDPAIPEGTFELQPGHEHPAQGGACQCPACNEPKD